MSHRPNVAVFGAFLALILHAALVSAAVLPRYDALLFVPIACALARAVFQGPPRSRLLACVAFLLISGCAVYVNQLTTGVEGRHALVGGIIPWSDAEGFLANAWRSIHGLRFSTQATLTAMRPLYPMSLAATIVAAGGNVKVAIALYATAVAAIMGACAAKLGARYGWRAMATALVIFSFYERRYLFVIGTESLGVLAGLLSFWCMLHAFDERGERIVHSKALLAAFALLGIALSARPGPMLILPLLLAWVWRHCERAIRARATGGAAAALIVAMLFNSVVVHTTGEGGAPGGEFPPILYGALHGEDYTYLADVHPEVAGLPQSERLGKTVGLMVDEVKAKPWLALGFAQGAAAFFGTPHGLFSLGFYTPDDSAFEGKGGAGAVLARAVGSLGVYRFANLIAMGAAAGAFVLAIVLSLWRGRRVLHRRPSAPQDGAPLDALGAAAYLVLLGAAASACVTPPWITEGAQLQASTLGYLVVVPWLSLSTAGSRGTPANERGGWWAPGLAFAVWLGVAFALSVAHVAAGRDAGLPSAEACKDDHALLLEPSMLVEVRGRGAGGYDLERMAENFRFVGKHNPDLIEPLKRLAEPGVGFEMAFDGCSGRAALAVGPAHVLAAYGRSWRSARPFRQPLGDLPPERSPADGSRIFVDAR